MEISQSQKAFNPTTTIYLMRGVPLDADYNLTLHFTSLSAQRAYFAQYRVFSAYANTYQRINSQTIRIEKKADEILDCNYLAFQNGNNGKWIYCFIREINYINEVTSEIVYQLDLLQTYYLDYTVLPCYIEREHVANDSLYNNLVQEGMSVNFYQKASQSRSTFWSYWTPVVLTTLDKDGNIYTQNSESAGDVESQILAMDEQIKRLEALKNARDVDYPLPDLPQGNGGGNGSGLPSNPDNGNNSGDNGESGGDDSSNIPDSPSLAVGVSQIDGVYCACNMFSFPSIAKYKEFFEAVANNGTQDGIITAYMVPRNFIKNYSSTEISQVSSYNASTPPNSTITVNRFTGSFDGYKPKNNKLYTYPFCYILASSGDDSMEFKFEGFAGASCQFQEYCSLIPNPTAISVPKNYMVNNDSANGSLNYLYCLSMSNFPTCSYAIDSYKAWVAQNSNTINNQYKWMGIDTTMNTVKGITGAVSSALSMDFGGVVNGAISTGEALINGARQYDAMNAKMNDAMKVPASATKPEASGPRFAHNAKDFRYYTMVCDKTTAQTVDAYFSRYGYKCNLLKVPNDNVRRNFTFTQTIDCKITGNIPAKDQSMIEALYNKGITFWNPYASKIGDYTIDNPPMGSREQAEKAQKEDEPLFYARMKERGLIDD